MNSLSSSSRECWCSCPIQPSTGRQQGKESLFSAYRHPLAELQTIGTSPTSLRQASRSSSMSLLAMIAILILQAVVGSAPNATTDLYNINSCYGLFLRKDDIVRCFRDSERDMRMLRSKAWKIRTKGLLARICSSLALRGSRRQSSRG